MTGRLQKYGAITVAYAEYLRDNGPVNTTTLVELNIGDQWDDSYSQDAKETIAWDTMFKAVEQGYATYHAATDSFSWGREEIDG